MKFLLCTYWDVQTSVHSPDSLNFLVGCTVVLYILWCNPIFESQSVMVHYAGWSWPISGVGPWDTLDQGPNVQ